jgi:hypothetical protein
MKRPKLKPGKIWALRFRETSAAHVATSVLGLTWLRKKDAVALQKQYPESERPELVALWVEEI